jgi:integrase
LIVLNQYAKSIVDDVTGKHDTHVFTDKGKSILKINNSSWKRARKVANLVGVRVHDLKHTFGRRLRSASVSNETLKVLIEHKNGDITSHYSGEKLGELIVAANKVWVAIHTVALLKKISRSRSKR